MKREQGAFTGKVDSIRVSAFQYFFAVIAILALVALGASSIIESKNAGLRSKILSNVESPAASIIFTQRETLVYATKLALWSNGGTTRREVQIARNLLAQRLAVVDTSGKSMGERANSAYWRALRAADNLVASSPAGILPESMHRDLNQVLLPVIDDILAAARDLVVSYQKSIDREMETYHRERARQDSFNLALLYLFIISGSLALLLNIRGNFRNYRAAREELAEAERVVTQLKDLDSAKNSLISTVNHELRTPLTSIIGYIEILRRDVAEKPKEEISNYLEVIERNSLILLRLVESLLSLSKFDGNKGQLPDEDVNLLEVLDTAIFAINPSAQSKDIAVKREGLLPVYVKGNIGQLNQVFINLLTNAIKFSPSQSEVVISMRIIKASKVEITIQDQGIGISEEDLPRIFTRFFRAEGVKNQGFEGFGLGLAIVHQAVSHHEGRIEVTSKLGEGSTFIVTLPVSKEENLIEA